MKKPTKPKTPQPRPKTLPPFVDSGRADLKMEVRECFGGGGPCVKPTHRRVSIFWGRRRGGSWSIGLCHDAKRCVFGDKMPELGTYRVKLQLQKMSPDKEKKGGAK